MDKFKVLEILMENKTISQKNLSEKLNISIGKVNYLINALVESGDVIVEKVGKGSKYRVTQQAKEYMLSKIEEMQQTKINFHEEKNRKVRQAVILAAGEKKEFDRPVCLIEIEEDVTLLSRMLQALTQNGVEEIFIVVGYKKEAFNEVPLPPNVKLIESDKFKWTGSMHSLSLVADYVTDDFILIEDDIVIEEVAIEKLINFEERDCLLIMNESDSKDEAYVEIRNGYLYKISKDLHQLNRIDGEMIGITKISKAVYDEMMSMYRYNKNPFMHYEYMLIDVSRKIDIGYFKMNDLLWAEIDNLAQYDEVVKKVYPILKKKEIRIKKQEVKQTLEDVLNIPIEKIRNVRPFGGMTNLNYRVTIEGKDYVVRMPGIGTDEFINRYEEMENLKLAASIGINPKELFFNPDTGLKITRMIPDAETLTTRMTKKEEIMKMVTAIFRKLHQSGLEMKNDFELFKLMEKYESIARSANGIFFESFEEVKKEVYEIKRHYEKMPIQYAPTHIDALWQNLIKSGDEKMYLIDWEYSGMFDPLWDLATHSIESEFTESEEELFFTHYFQREVEASERERILIHKIFQDYLWSLWTIFKEARGDNFGTYGIDRFERCKKNLAVYHSIYGKVVSS